MSIAWIFPGQGTQYVGMGRSLLSVAPEAQATLDEADEALGFKLSALLDEGPAETLTLTENNQPAILTVSVAWARALLSRGAQPPAGVAGHSLGELSALVVAGVLAFDDAVRVVRARGAAMQRAVPSGEGAMAAVAGVNEDRLLAICAAQPGVCELAAMNTPGQLVIAGATAAVKGAVSAVEAEGGRGTLLNVSAPFHCSMLAPAAEALAEVLTKVTLRPPTVPVLHNVDAAPCADPAEIRARLVAQVTQPVLWERCLRGLITRGADRFVEVGPGRTLAPMVKKTDRAMDCVSVDRAGALQTILSWEVR